MNGLNRLFVKGKQGTKKEGVGGKALRGKWKYGGGVFVC